MAPSPRDDDDDRVEPERLLEGGVRIGTGAIYALLLKVKDEVTEVRLSTSQTRLDLENRMTRADAAVADLAKRVRGLELRFYGILAGLLGAITIFVASGGAFK